MDFGGAVKTIIIFTLMRLANTMNKFIDIGFTFYLICIGFNVCDTIKSRTFNCVSFFIIAAYEVVWRKKRYSPFNAVTFLCALVSVCVPRCDLELINDIVILSKCCVAMEIWALSENHNQIDDFKSATNSKLIQQNHFKTQSVLRVFLLFTPSLK